MHCRSFVVATLSLSLVIAARSVADEPQPAELKAAEQLLLRGKYDEAGEQFQPLVSDHPEAAIGLARCYLATGKAKAAQTLLFDSVAQHTSDATLHAELALLGLEIGEQTLAEEESAAAIKLDANCLPARWVAAELLRLRGRLTEAEKAYGWFIDRQRQLAGGPQLLAAESLHWIGLAAAQHARWTRNQRLFHSLVNDLYPSAIKQNPDFWPAHLQTALLFQEKYNEADS